MYRSAPWDLSENIYIKIFSWIILCYHNTEIDPSISQHWLLCAYSHILTKYWYTSPPQYLNIIILALLGWQDYIKFNYITFHVISIHVTQPAPDARNTLCYQLSIYPAQYYFYMNISFKSYCVQTPFLLCIVRIFPTAKSEIGFFTTFPTSYPDYIAGLGTRRGKG